MPQKRIFVLDNYDSFTFTLVDYLLSLGAEVEVRRNDELTVADAVNSGHDGFLISPGPGEPVAAGISVELAAGCIQSRRPLLGVCLGHQAIGLACGSRIGRVAPMHGKIARVTHDDSGLFRGLPSPLPQTRYHSLAVLQPEPPLVANAWSEDGIVQGMRHRDAPVHGVQFHPESIASTHGHELLRNFLDVCA